MPGKRFIALVAIALFAAVAGYLFGQRQQPTHETIDTRRANPIVGQPSLTFTLPDLKGQARQFEEWRGKVVLLNFWATWCPPCREEIPLFMQLQAKYATAGLQIVGIALDEREAVQDYRDGLLIDYPLLVGAQDVAALMSDYGNLTGVLPYSVIIDRNGRVHSTKTGAYTHAELDALLQPLLTPGAPANAVAD